METAVVVIASITLLVCLGLCVKIDKIRKWQKAEIATIDQIYYKIEKLQDDMNELMSNQYEIISKIEEVQSTANSTDMCVKAIDYTINPPKDGYL
jgi:hypothetical protein